MKRPLVRLVVLAIVHAATNAIAAVTSFARTECSCRSCRKGYWISLLLIAGLAGCGRDDGALPSVNGRAAELPARSGEDSAHVAPQVSIELVRASQAGEPDRFEVRGLNPDAVDRLVKRQMDEAAWKRLLTVSVVAGDEDYPPMLGEYAIDGGLLVFTPQFPLADGAAYRAVFTPAELDDSDIALADVVTEQFTLPTASTGPAATVTAIYPSADTLPENQLKFYIHFSAPMSRGEAYRRIHLMTADGDEVADPFLELAEELWDRDGMRFTLFIDPGRIKRGLKPREEVGPALEEGKSYTLVVDAGWLDAGGRPLKEPHKKPFKVGAPDETQPDYTAWQLAVPPSDSTAPLVVTFDEPLDRGMLERVLAVHDAEGEPLAGDITIEGGETLWKFRPQSSWRPGEHRLVIGTALEDRAGNSIARPFETIIGEEPTQPAVGATVSRPFTIEPASPRP